MKTILHTKINDAISIASSLFQRGKTSGSSANLSFKHDEYVYITASGSCFGFLKEDDFAVLDMEGRHLRGPEPSKELPLHLTFYKRSSALNAVIHTHSFYSTLWSCYVKDMGGIPKYTPYLAMKLGKVPVIPYAPPGTEKLFDLFRAHYEPDLKGYLLKNHGPVVGEKDLFSAFFCLEELEESCHMAWELRGEDRGIIV